MNFDTFKVIKQSNTVSSSIKSEPNLVEGQPKRPREAQGFNSYQQVYQGCDTCKTEMRYYILDGVVTCLGCKGSYKLVSKDKCNLN